MGTSRMPHKEYLLRIATEFNDVVPQPLNGKNGILGKRGEADLGIKAIIGSGKNHARFRELFPDGSVVVFSTPTPTASMKKKE